MADITIRKHTEVGIARRTPGIKKLAGRYNALCSTLQKHSGRSRHPRVGIPAPLDIDELFNPEANGEMWLESGLTDDGPFQPPRYLYDESVKTGIVALLMKDRAKEENRRLTSELRLMIDWVHSAIEAVEKAIVLCKGEVS